jgi:2-C-methyl-D-erythritol 4-phosphate cytidylyltransferase
MLTAIIVAAGSSKRAGFDKLLAKIAGRPVIHHTLAAFEKASCVSDVLKCSGQRGRVRRRARCGAPIDNPSRD